jgi:hypothetical protein
MDHVGIRDDLFQMIILRTVINHESELMSCFFFMYTHVIVHVNIDDYEFATLLKTESGIFMELIFRPYAVFLFTDTGR